MTTDTSHLNEIVLAHPEVFRSLKWKQVDGQWEASDTQAFWPEFNSRRTDFMLHHGIFVQRRGRKPSQRNHS